MVKSKEELLGVVQVIQSAYMRLASTAKRIESSKGAWLRELNRCEVLDRDLLEPVHRARAFNRLTIDLAHAGASTADVLAAAARGLLENAPDLAPSRRA